MNLDWKKIGIGVGALIVILLAIFLFLFFFQNKNTTTGQTNPGNIFGTPAGNNPTESGNSNGSNSGLPVFSSNGSGNSAPVSLVFKIADGPIVGATLIDVGHPTETIARYVTAEDGHILDLPLDMPGATPRIVSDITIPGIERVLWSEKGSGVILQYLDQGALKSVHIGLSAATSSVVASSTPNIPVAVHFLPDNIVDVASSPDGTSIVYALQSGAGITGYISKPDGSNGKKLFSLPLSQIMLSWPAAGAILVTSKSASGIAGISFSINTKTGAATPVLYGSGLTATGNSTFSYLLYRTDDGTNATLFSENVASGASNYLSFVAPLQAPIPEQCAWSVASSTEAYCAAPAVTLPSGYLDLWYRGQSSIADSLVSIDARSGSTTALATPGTRDGGEPSDMIHLSLSAGNKYLSFISKDDQVLWGVHLTQ